MAEHLWDGSASDGSRLRPDQQRRARERTVEARNSVRVAPGFQHPLLGLQARVGNRAVTSLLAPLIQRQLRTPVGVNARAKPIPDEGKSMPTGFDPKAPVTTHDDGTALPGGWTGLGKGSEKSFRVGKTDRILLTGVHTGVAARQGGRTPSTRAVALVPDSVRKHFQDHPGGNVAVLVHLHGTQGEKQMTESNPIDTDQAQFDMAGQLEAFLADRPGARLIALLPRGSTYEIHKKGKNNKNKVSYWVNFGKLDIPTFVDSAISQLQDVLRGATAGGLVLSGHSAGGGILSGKLDEVFKDKRLEGRRLGVFAFEAHGDEKKWKEFALTRLYEDLARLKELGKSAPGAPDAAAVLHARTDYLTKNGVRLISMAGERAGPYRNWVVSLRGSICDWFDDHAGEVKTATGNSPALLNAWWANYQALLVPGAQHEDIVGGAHHDLYRALSMLPKVGALAPSGATPATSTPKTTPGPKKASTPASPPRQAPAGTNKMAGKDGPPAPANVPTPPAPHAPRRSRQGASHALPPGAITSARLGELGTPDETLFRRRVYDRQLQLKLSQGGQYFSGLSRDELGTVDGKPIHKSAETDARNLLAAATRERTAQRDKSDPTALSCRSIGVGNAYRDPERDFSAWQGAYATYYRETAEARAELADGPFGEKATEMIVKKLIKYKALAGFSNHTKGLAIDFKTVQNGVELTTDHRQDELWEKSWLYKWLTENAATYHFTQLPSEKWHWDHTAAPVTGKSDAETGQLGTAASPGPAAPEAQPAAPRSAPAGVEITFGAHARRADVAQSSLDVLRDVLVTAGLHQATISSTSRTAADQARVMYQNLAGHGKGMGVRAQHHLYGPAGDAVIDVYADLHAKGRSAKEIQAAMRDKIVEIGPSKVTRHCGDPATLNVFDVAPSSIGDDTAQAAFVAAAQAEVGKRISRFIAFPKDPGHHFEIRPK